jgi:hypothetical protein
MEVDYWGLLKKSEMRRMQGTDMEDVNLILRIGCNEVDTVFLVDLKKVQIRIFPNWQCTEFLRYSTKFMHSKCQKSR